MDGASVAKGRLSEAVNLISGTTVSAVLYTLVVVLYCLSARLSYSQLWKPDGKIKRPTALTLILASVMIICATMDVTLSNLQRRITYVDYGTLPGGPLALPASLHATTVTRVRFFVRLLDDLLISGVLVWRVLIVWNRNPFVKIITLILYVTHIAIAITDSVLQWQIAGQVISTSDMPRLPQITFIVSITFGAANLVFMTLMLVIRLLSARWQYIGVMGKSEAPDHYLGIIAILIESYALETAWNLAFCIFCALQYVPVNDFFDATITQVDVLTNLLVIYRVVSGRAWDRRAPDEVSGSLRWNRNAQSGVTTGTANP